MKTILVKKWRTRGLINFWPGAVFIIFGIITLVKFFNNGYLDGINPLDFRVLTKNFSGIIIGLML